ncbi:hypothetical protein GCM10025734_62810 [Kitasatospora paranensis]|uniref:hypothetical protein n=1 Tax=Kitasatospora paranensis TaxID=258053 RepID=UPI0031EE3666
MDDLRSRLRDAADGHRPDRERMLARVERGMARPSPTAPVGTGSAPPCCPGPKWCSPPWPPRAP